MFNTVPEVSGVYLITNLFNYKVYVGSSLNIKKRSLAHKSLLRRNKHGNKYLQNAINKYSLDNFIFELIEALPTHLLREREAFWINAYDATNRKIGYNIAKDTNCPLRGIKQTKETRSKIAKANKHIWANRQNYSLIDPTGNIVVFHSIKQFSKKHNLLREKIGMVLNGKRKHHKGWRSIETKDFTIFDKDKYFTTNKGFTFINPSGTVIYGQSLSFFKQFGIKTSKLSDVYRGKRHHHKGWRKFNEKYINIKFQAKENYVKAGKLHRKHISLRDPNNIIVNVVGIMNFCKINKLSKTQLYRLRTKKIKSYKGWTLA